MGNRRKTMNAPRPAIVAGLIVLALLGFAILVKYGHEKRTDAIPAHLKAVEPY
jgi:hypothetical protein